MAVVMAITVNAVFVGLYQHREREFAVYNAIGFTRKEVVLKLLKELVLLDAIGLAAGGAVTLLCVYLINGLYLIPHGMRLFMFNGVALLGLIICNVMVLLPLLVTRSRKLARADICEF
jgi:ABC-type antimicrobial peptide transport system permease subunit